MKTGRSASIYFLEFILILFAVPTASLATLDSTEKIALQMITREIGEIYSDKDKPAIYRSLRAMLARLADAQESLDSASEHFVTHSQVLLVKNPEPVACVLTLQRQAVPGQRNYVVVSTGMLALLGADPFDDHPELGSKEMASLLAKMLSGVVGHEMAHPIFYQDYSMRNSTKQTEEILADGRGVQIALRAGYPREGLLQGLKLLARYQDAKIQDSILPIFFQDQTAKTVAAGLSTHPQEVLRNTHLRALLLVRKMLEGSPAPKYPVAEAQAYLRELGQVFAELNLTDQNKNQPIEIKNLTDGIRQYEASDTRSVRRQLLLLKIDELLRSAPISSTESITAWLDSLKMFDVLPLSSADRKSGSKRSGEISGLYKLGYENDYYHTDYILDSPFYRSQAWVEAVFNSFPIYKKSWKILDQLLPPDIVFKTYGSQMLESLRAKNNDFISNFESGFDGLSLRHQLQWAEVFHRLIFPELSDELLGNFLQIWSMDEANFFPVSFFVNATSMRIEEATQSAGNEIKKLFADHPNDQKAFKALCEYIWQHRERYILFDFLSGEGRLFFWDLIFENVGVSVDEGRKELNRNLLTSLKNRKFHQSISELIARVGQRYKSSEVPLPWISTDSISAIRKIIYADIVAEQEKIAHDLELTREQWLPLVTPLRAQVSGLRVSFRRAYQANPELFRGDFRSAFEHEILVSGRLATPDTVQKITEKIVKEMIGLPIDRVVHQGNASIIQSNLPAPIEDIIAETILKMPFPLRQRQTLLHGRYLMARPVRSGFYRNAYAEGDLAEDWFFVSGYQSNEKVFEVLKTARMLGSVGDLLGIIDGQSQHHNYPFDGGYIRAQEGDFLRVELAMSRLILDEIESARQIRSPYQRTQKLIQLSQRFLRKGPKDFNHEGYDKEAFRAMRFAILNIARETPMPLEKRIQLFEVVTLTGSVAATDAYYIDTIQPYLSTLTPETNRLMRRLLSGKRFVSKNLSIKLASRLLQNQAVSLHANFGVTSASLLKFLEDIDVLIPTDSFLKDELVENLSWRLDLQEDKFLRLMESHKTTNWRRLNPQMINWASFIAENLNDLARSEIKNIINYMVDPNHRDLPSSVDRAFLRAASDSVDTAIKARGNVGSPIDPDERAQLIKEAVELIKGQFITLAKDSSPMDRVPIFDLLLHSGVEPFSADANFPYNVIDEILQYTKGSGEEIALRSWLETVPAEDQDFEPSMSVSFQISTMGGEKSSIKTGFELFGTPGKKLGQGASIFEIFDLATNDELKDLKENNRGMSKLEIKDEIARHLSHRNFKLISRLGSASAKTVVLIQIDGEPKARAVHLRNPGAVETLKMHISRGKAFVARMKENGLEQESELFNAYIEALEQSIPDELDFRIEAKKYAEMREFYQKINKSMSGELGPWTFEVPEVDPRLIAEDFFMTDYVEGDAFDELPSSDSKSFVGRMIFKSSVFGLLRFGSFEPDRHVKNLKVSMSKKIIYMLDPGQFQKFTTSISPFREDDRSLIAKFILGVSTANADLIIKSITGMRSAKSMNFETENLRSDIESILQVDASITGRVINIIKMMHRKGFVLDFKFSFTAFKGLMVLLKEGYVDMDTAKLILRPLVISTLQRKLQFSVLHDAYARENATIGAISCKAIFN